jgi:ABC-type multidrug transport system permease subunit
LFLDEPTSGLDSRAALIVMRGVKRIALTGRSVLCTIHQPSAEVFFLFDKLMLLQTGGREVFVGDIGAKGKDLIKYFEHAQPNPIHNSKCPKGTNPASWMLEMLGEAKAAMGSDNPPIDYAELYKKSELYNAAHKRVEELSKPLSGKKQSTFATKYATSLWIQTKYTTERAFISYWRNTAFTFTRLVLLLCLGIIFGIVYLQLDNDTFSGFNSKISVLFLALAFCGVVNSSTSLPVLIRDRAVYYRESASYTYASIAYSFAITVVELPYIAAGSILFVIPFYFLVGFVNDAGLFFLFLLMHFINSITFSSIGQFMSAALPHIVAAAQLQGLVFFFCFLFGGIFLTPSKIPAGWKWMYYVDPLPRSVTGIAVTQFKHCEGSSSGCPLIQFPAPINKGMTAIDYFVESFETNRDSYWAMFGWLILTYVILRVFCILALAFISHVKR